jgi:hypothetical protein
LSTQTLYYLIGAALFMHGVGHILGIFKPATSLFSLKLSQGTLKVLGDVIWVIVVLGFVAASLGYFGILVPASWWRPLAAIFAVVSLIGLILFGRNWPKFNLSAAALFNIVVLVALLWYHYPAEALFNR